MSAYSTIIKLKTWDELQIYNELFTTNDKNVGHYINQ